MSPFNGVKGIIAAPWFDDKHRRAAVLRQFAIQDASLLQIDNATAKRYVPHVARVWVGNHIPAINNYMTARGALVHANGPLGNGDPTGMLAELLADFRQPMLDAVDACESIIDDAIMRYEGFK